MFHIVYDKNSYYIGDAVDMHKSHSQTKLTHNNTNLQDEQLGELWRVVLQSEQITLGKNDVLRFGRVIFNVSELCTSDEEYRKLNQQKQMKAQQVVAEILKRDQQSQKSIVIPAQRNYLRDSEVTIDVTQGDQKSYDNSMEGEFQKDSVIDVSLPFRRKRRRIVNASIDSILNEKRAERTRLLSSFGQRMCRICLESDFSEDNPLVTPCRCIGSLRYIHLECIRSWTNSKKQSYESVGITSYYWSDLVCEICKHKLLLQIWVNGELLELLDVPRPLSHRYMILQSDNSSAQRAIHILDFSVVQTFKIGRRATNHISIADVSVSRDQGTIEFDLLSNLVSLIDKRSKYGTFVKIRKLLEVQNQKRNQINNRHSSLSIMSGKTCFFFYTENRFSNCQKLSLCLQNKTKETHFDYYDLQIQKYPKKLHELLYPPPEKDPELTFEKKLKRFGLDVRQVSEESQFNIVLENSFTLNARHRNDTKISTVQYYDQNPNFVISEEQALSPANFMKIKSQMSSFDSQQNEPERNEETSQKLEF